MKDFARGYSVIDITLSPAFAEAMNSHEVNRSVDRIEDFLALLENNRACIHNNRRLYENWLAESKAKSEAVSGDKRTRACEHGTWIAEDVQLELVQTLLDSTPDNQFVILVPPARAGQLKEVLTTRHTDKFEKLEMTT